MGTLTTEVRASSSTTAQIVTAKGLPTNGLACSLLGHFPNDPEYVTELCAEIKARTGLALMAVRPGDPVNGHIGGWSKQAGLPFVIVKGVITINEQGVVMDTSFTAEIDTCPQCEQLADRNDPHTCIEVILYEEFKAPNAVEKGFGPLRRMRPAPGVDPLEKNLHLSPLVPHGLGQSGKDQLRDIILSRVLA